MTTTTAPAPAAPTPDAVDIFEQKIAKAKQFLKGQKWDEKNAAGSAAFMFEELVQLFKHVRSADIVPVAQKVEEIIDYLDDEESLAEHANDYLVELSAFMLKALIRAGYLDQKKGWTGPEDLAEEFRELDQKTADFRTHVLAALEDDDDDDDDDEADEGAAPAPPAPARGLELAPPPAQAAAPDPAPPGDPAPPPGDGDDTDDSDDDDNGDDDDGDDDA